MRSTLLLTVASTTGAWAATLADVCTTSYVESVLPADNFIQGVTLSAESVTANAVSNYTVAAGTSAPGKSGLNFCNVTFSFSHAGLDDKVGLSHVDLYRV